MESRQQEIIKILDLFNSKYDCKICRRKLRYKADEIIHLKLMHQTQETRLIKCPICSNVSKTFYHLKIHLMKDHLNERPYGCRLCKKKFHAFVQLKRHFRACVLSSKSSPQTSYFKNFSSLIEYENSTIYSESQIRYVNFLKKIKFNEVVFKPNQIKYFTIISQVYTKKCAKCSKDFHSNSEYLAHVWTEHLNKSNFNCWSCTTITNNLTSLEEHLNISHLNEKLFKCSICSPDVYFNSIEKAKSHFKLDHSSNHSKIFFTFACPVCDRMFSRYDQFLKHSNCRSKEKPFECLHCRDVFFDRSAFDLHLAQHSYVAKMSIKNSLNNKQYSVDSILNSTKTRKTAFRIDDIASKIISKKQKQLEQQMEQNLVVQSPIKIIPTSNNLNLLHLTNLKNHSVLTNSAFVIPNQINDAKSVSFLKNFTEKAENFLRNNEQLFVPIQSASIVNVNQSSLSCFKCEFCGYSFKTHIELVHHKILHSSANPKRPFKCHLCLVTFGKSDQLSRHMIVHQASEQDSVCHICFSSFSRKQDLDRHMLFHSK